MLKVIRVDDIARTLDRPFVMQQIARVDHFGVFMYLCQGFVQRHQHTTQDELFYVYRGILVMNTDWGQAAPLKGAHMAPVSFAHTVAYLEFSAPEVRKPAPMRPDFARVPRGQRVPLTFVLR